MFSHFQIQTRNKYLNLTEHLITTLSQIINHLIQRTVNKMSLTS